jgi:DNA-binding transcriptional MerR regulator
MHAHASIVEGSVGYSLQWVASEINVSPRTIHDWVAKGLFRGLAPGRGCREYSPAFVARARVIHQWLQYYPRGPLENLRDQLNPEESAA